MVQNRFVYLISHKFSGDITPEEGQELKNLLEDDVLLQEKYTAFQRMRTEPDKDQQPDVEKALQKVWEQIQKDKGKHTVNSNVVSRWNRSFIIRFTGIAAAIIIVIFGSGAMYLSLERKTENENTAAAILHTTTANLLEKQNTKGIRSSIVLSDGSKIWLNADSKLEYPNVFEGKTREVYLSGEAFFEVAKNPTRPFIIHLDNGTVRVLGTSFNIKAYRGSNIVETSVSTGRVAFIPKKKSTFKPADTTFLTHDVKAIYSIKTGEIKTLTTVSNDDKAWTEGRLVFKALTFGDIAIELERTFGKKVVFADEEIKQYRLTGSFENNSLDEILYYLSLSKPFTYRISDEEIIIGKVDSM